MRTEPPSPPSSEHRVRAKRLLKQLRRSESEGAALEAAARFRRLASFSDASVFQILDHRDGVKLKHALAVVALEQGYDSWRTLKAAAGSGGREMYDPRMDVYLNRWFARYEDARASLEDDGGFLFPYGRQFFVCGEGAVRVLGLDPGDPDWDRIGRDWARPEDEQAWLRLRERRERVLRGLA